MSRERWSLAKMKREGQEESELGGESWRLIKKPYVALLCVDLVVAGVAWTFLDPVLEKHVKKKNGLGPLATGE